MVIEMDELQEEIKGCITVAGRLGITYDMIDEGAFKAKGNIASMRTRGFTIHEIDAITTFIGSKARKQAYLLNKLHGEITGIDERYIIAPKYLRNILSRMLSQCGCNKRDMNTQCEIQLDHFINHNRQLSPSSWELLMETLPRYLVRQINQNEDLGAFTRQIKSKVRRTQRIIEDIKKPATVNKPIPAGATG